MRFVSIFLVQKNRKAYDETLKVLAEAKPITDNFFDNVIVNDENSDIKKSFRITYKCFVRLIIIL